MSNNSKPKAKAFLEWIHCNRCYEIYINKRRIFYLLAGCYHVVCAQCARPVEHSDKNGPLSYRCPLCLKVVRGCPLGNAMPKHLKDLFHPEPYKDGLNTSHIMQFQAKHQQRFLEHINRRIRSQAELMQNIEKFREMARKIYQELQQAKIDCKQIEKRVLLVRKRQRYIEQDQTMQNGQQEEAAAAAAVATNLPANTHETSVNTQGSQRRSVTAAATASHLDSQHLSIQRLLHLSSRASLQGRHALPGHSKSSSSSTRNTIISFMQPMSASFNL